METSGIGADSDSRVETNVLIAGHRDEGLTFNKLGRLKTLNVAQEEQKSCMRLDWDDAMVDVKNGLVFMESETLVVVAKDAVDRVFKTSERFIRETQAQVSDACGSTWSARRHWDVVVRRGHHDRRRQEVS